MAFDMPPFSVPVSYDDALAALRAAAWTIEPDRVYEPVMVIEGEQLYRDATPPARTVIHCFAGGIGADWDLDRAEAFLGLANDILWVPHLLRHDLWVRRDDTVRCFDVSAPNQALGELRRQMKESRKEAGR